MSGGPGRISKGGSTMSEAAKAVEPAKRASTPTPLKLVTPGEILDRMQRISDSVARRAFEIFEGNGGIFGSDWDNWFKAEQQLLHPVHIEVSEKDNEVLIRAETPGFTANDLEVNLEGRRLTVAGKRETKEERKDEKTIYSERCSDEILRVIDLPADVDAEKAVATVKDGVLELKIPKAAPAKKIPIQSSAA